jgi:type II secretion system protein H
MMRRGFTLIEIVMVLTLIGIMLAVAVPYIGSSTNKGNVRGAMDALSTLHAMAKQSAIQRGRQAMLVLNAGSGSATVVARNAAGTGWDTLETAEMDDRFGVTLTSTRDTLIFTPRGIGTELSGTTIIVTKGDAADTITVSAAGRLVR